MFINWSLLKQDVLTYNYWLQKRLRLVDILIIGTIYGVFGVGFIILTIETNAALADLFMGPFFAVMWTMYLIPIPWLAEQTSMARFKFIDDQKMKLILRTRLVEQFLLVECFQVLFIVLALLGNVLHPNAIKSYHFNFLAVRVGCYFFLMIGFEIFMVVLATYISFHYMNYVRFTYTDLIPKERPPTVSESDYRKLMSKLKKLNQFSADFLGSMTFILLFFIIIFCLPISFYMLFIGNYPSNATQNPLIMSFSPYLIILGNAFFIVAGLVVWAKIPHVLRTIPEELYTIPPDYVAILQRLHPDIETLQNTFTDQK